MSLQQQIIDFLAPQGKVPIFGPALGIGGATVVMQEDANEMGPYIAFWDDAALGPPPTIADGFTEWQLHRVAEVATPIDSSEPESPPRR